MSKRKPTEQHKKSGPHPRPVWERLELRIHYDPLSGCWLWGGRCSRDGYGRCSVPGSKGTNKLVHVVVYEYFVGPVPKGLQLDHKCRVRSCCNWRHVEPVTNKENLLRGNGWSGRHARKTHAPCGHPYDVMAKGREGRPHRHCRACTREQHNAGARRRYALRAKPA